MELFEVVVVEHKTGGDKLQHFRGFVPKLRFGLATVLANTVLVLDPDMVMAAGDMWGHLAAFSFTDVAAHQGGGLFFFAWGGWVWRSGRVLSQLVESVLGIGVCFGDTLQGEHELGRGDTFAFFAVLLPKNFVDAQL